MRQEAVDFVASHFRWVAFLVEHTWSDLKSYLGIGRSPLEPCDPQHVDDPYPEPVVDAILGLAQPPGAVGDRD